MKKMAMIAALLSMGWTARIPALQAQSVTSTLVKVPFAFVAGNQVMPAGTYRIEALTKGKPGIDALEVVTLRGRDVKSYASFVTVLDSADTQAAKLTFKRTPGSAILMEVQSSGKRLVMPHSKYDSITEANYHFEEIAADEVATLQSSGQI